MLFKSNVLLLPAVINDSAERAMKIVCDLAENSWDADRRDNAVICVKDKRELVNFHHLSKEEVQTR